MQFFQEETQLAALCGFFSMQLGRGCLFSSYMFIGTCRVAIIIFLYIYLPTQTMSSFPKEKEADFTLVVIPCPELLP